MRLVGISGSLRAASYNSALLRAAQGMTPDGVELVEGSIRGIPLYDGDVERDQGLPEAVVALKELIADSDGLLLFTPEYNNGVPGVFKNAIDWLSRPASDIDRVFGGRPVAVLGASPGPFGTVMSQAAWLPVLRTLGTAPWFGARMMIPHAGDAFDAEGRLVDENARRRLERFIGGFAEHCRTVAR
ncbi:NADPH-dependent FMN reductase [Brevundimonas sp.]|uniref:NADPH-dependent FMN reductase n=1 Tax=Brevundimonas sp. TaxID=1871086 RepID=UPI003D6D599D